MFLFDENTVIIDNKRARSVLIVASTLIVDCSRRGQMLHFVDLTTNEAFWLRGAAQ